MWQRGLAHVPAPRPRSSIDLFGGDPAAWAAFDPETLTSRHPKRCSRERTPEKWSAASSVPVETPPRAARNPTSAVRRRGLERLCGGIYATEWGRGSKATPRRTAPLPADRRREAVHPTGGAVVDLADKRVTRIEATRLFDVLRTSVRWCAF
jgi:hypothetical protein